MVAAGMNIRMAKPANNLRTRELAQIHIAKKQLGLDDDTYRAVLFTVGRVHSAADLDYHGRQAVLRHFKSRGWKNKPARKAKTSRPLASDDQSKMIRGIWLELHAKGAVNDSSEAALASYVKRITNVDALQWLTTAQASRVIETLKKWLDRL